MSRASVISGANVVVYVNGTQFGRVRGFQFQSSTPRKAIYGLDSVDPQELAPTTAKVTATLNVYRTVGDGGAEGAGMATNSVDLTSEKYFTVQLIDRGSDTILFEARGCSLQNQSWDFPQKGIVTGTLSFEALSWDNEIKALGTSH